MTQEHWSSPNGCHPDCPACKTEFEAFAPEVLVEETALITILQLIEMLPDHHIEQALSLIDLSDEAWDEQLQIVKDAVGFTEKESP